MKLIGGFEATRFSNSTTLSNYDTTNHYRCFREDLELVKASGIRTLRYTVPWERVEPSLNTFDWSWMDQAIQTMQDLGLEPILDLMHHKPPSWIREGCLNPDFPRLLRIYAKAVARRYPWVTHFTPINEPYLTSYFSGELGMWEPYGTTPGCFVQIALNMARAHGETVEMLRKLNPDVTIVYIDTCEHHTTDNSECEDFARFANERRWLVHDLVCGMVNSNHPLYPFLRHFGMTDDQETWLHGNAFGFDVLGLDYYCFSEKWYTSLQKADTPGEVQCPSPRPLGFAAVAKQYYDRYKKPVLLGETNIRGTVTDRIRWLKIMARESEKLAVAIRQELWGFCWFPLIDSTGWGGDSTGGAFADRIDPVGIYWLDEGREVRHASELSEVFTQLARGEITWEELPDHPFLPPLDGEMAGFC